MRNCVRASAPMLLRASNTLNRSSASAWRAVIIAARKLGVMATLLTGRSLSVDSGSRDLDGATGTAAELWPADGSALGPQPASARSTSASHDRTTTFREKLKPLV